jgi:hypothetical protein
LFHLLILVTTQKPGSFALEKGIIETSCGQVFGITNGVLQTKPVLDINVSGAEGEEVCM